MENFTSTTQEYDPNRACLDPEEEARFQARLKVAAEVAKKHGYYFSVLGEEQRVDYVIALAEGEGEEIALLKSEVKAMKAMPRFNISVFGHLVSLLDRMRRAHRAASMHLDKTAQLQTAVENAFRNLHIPRELMNDGFPPKRGPAPSPGLAPA